MSGFDYLQDEEHNVYNEHHDGKEAKRLQEKIIQIAQLIHQSINQSSKQARKQSSKQAINQAINQSSKQPSNQSGNQSINQSSNQLVHQSSKRASKQAQGGGGVLPENLDRGVRPLPKTLTLFMTKICNFPNPIYDLTLPAAGFI